MKSITNNERSVNKYSQVATQSSLVNKILTRGNSGVSHNQVIKWKPICFTWSNDQKETVKWSHGQAIAAKPCDQEIVFHMDGGKSCWQLGGWIAGSRWGSLGGGGRVVAAWAGFPLALRLPRRTQQLRFVPLSLSSWTEAFQKKVHPVLQIEFYHESCSISLVQNSCPPSQYLLD